MKVLGAEAGSSLRVPFKGQYDVGHKKAHILGGSNKKENLRFELSSDNRGKGTRERMVSDSKKLKAKNASAAAKASKAAKAEEGAAIVSEATKVEKSAAAVSETAKVEKAAATVAKGGSATKLLGKAAPIVSKLAKPLATAGKVLGKVAGPLGLIAAGAEFATAKTTGQKVDAGITAVSSALLMSKNPVAMAGGTGLMVGQALDKTLDVSDYSSTAGAHAYEGLKRMGVNDTVSFVAGGVVSVVAIPLAIPYAAADKAYKGLSSLGGWIKSKF
jgi:hypothetical protein